MQSDRPIQGRNVRRSSCSFTPPAIRAGVRAARIAVREIKKFLEQTSSMEKVLLVCFGQSAFDIHQKAASEIRMTKDE